MTGSETMPEHGLGSVRRCVPWVLAGQDPAALRASAAGLRAWLQRDPALRTEDVGLALAVQPPSGPHRAVVVGANRAELVGGLTALVRGESSPAVVRGHCGEVASPVFVFPGQGPQWRGMATSLLAARADFRQGIGAAADALRPVTGWSALDVLATAESDPRALDRVDVVQPLLFAIMVGLAKLWGDHGVRPAAVVGHSLGELPAAWLAGGLPLADAARVVARWSEAQQTLTGRGEMALVGLPAPEVAARLAGYGDRVGVAGVNAPTATLISGDRDAVGQAIAEFESAGVLARPIAVGLAAHSRHIDGIREWLLGELAGIAPHPGTVPYYSGLTGDRFDTATLDSRYWPRCLREPVLFDPAVRAAHAELARPLFIEISPHPVLTGSLREILDDTGDATPVVASLRRGQDEWRRFLLSLAEAYVHGVAVDWTRAFAETGARAPIADGLTGDPSWPLLDRVPPAPPAQTGGPGPLLDDNEPSGTESIGARRRFAALAPAVRESRLLATVRGEIAALLGRTTAESVPADAELRAEGFDSVAAVELRNRLAAVTGLALPPTVVFDHPTARTLAGHLRRELDGEGDGLTSGAENRAIVGDDEPVAIIGIGCRLPGGIDDPESLWRLLRDGAEVVGGLPTDRGWDLDRLHDARSAWHGPNRQREAGYLRNATAFDADFFGISPREALAMDPQQRLLLEVSWEALERARINPLGLRGSATGVFTGVTEHHYGPRLDAAPAELEGFVFTGSTASVAAGRVAYALGLEGPAMSVDTACSSSLVALHLAAAALRRGECDLALAGGATVLPNPGMFVEFSRKNALSADGRCRAFSADADGFGLAEGVAVVVVARLADARRAGWPVHALVRSSAVVSDGASNGLTAPKGSAQQRTIRRALAAAGLRPEDVDAVEAHGTGTPLGDPIEATALLAVYGRNRPADRPPVWLGSVKSNVGHTQAAAGLVGVIKMVLALQHRHLPRTLHVTAPTPHVDWAGGALRLLTQPVSWQSPGRPRRAGVSSFGVSGTNCHAILEQAPDEQTGEPDRDDVPGTPGALPWLLSARGDAALAAQAERLRTHVTALPAAGSARAIEDIGFSLATTRATLPHRAAIVAADLDGFTAGLDALHRGLPSAAVVRGAVDLDGDVVFVYPGQGAQWVGMARDMIGTDDVVTDRLRACADALAPHVDWSLLDVLRGTPGSPPLESVDVVQPALFAVMVALTAWWRAHGVEPAAVVGHSQGEIAAACAAGALSLDDAAVVVAVRARALREVLAGRGGMVAVALPEDTGRDLIKPWSATGRLAVAAVNGPDSLVVSGEPAALDALLRYCAADGTRARRIPVDYASHSAHVEAIRDRLLAALADIQPRTADLPFYSSVTAGPVDTAGLDADYWYRNLRQTVEFEQTTNRLLAAGHRAFVEVSPHPILTGAVAETAEATGRKVLVVGSLRRDEPSRVRLLTSAAELFVRGVPVDWLTAPRPDGAAARGQVDLPTYAFQRERFWLDSAGAPPAVLAADDGPDADFWAAVDRGAADELGDLLGIDGAPDRESLGAVLPALQTWRRHADDRATQDSWRFRVAWRPLDGAPPTTAALTGRWLLLVPSSADAASGADGEAARTAGLAASCTRAVRRSGAEPVIVPVDTAHVHRTALARQLRAAWRDDPAGGVLSLLALDTAADLAHPDLPTGYAATVSLMQALGDIQADGPLWCVTRGAVAAAPGDTLPAPAQSLLWGLAQVAAVEYPDLWGGVVDLPPAGGPPGPEPATGGSTSEDADIDLLCAAVAAGAGEDQLAVRHGSMLARRVVPAPLRQRRATRRWRPRGTILITGGTGGVGAQVARWLASAGADHLLLISRRGPAAPGAAALAEQLTATGTRVSVVACDVGDRAALGGLLDGLPADQPLRAVFHTAAVLDDTVTDRLTPERIAGVLRVKVRGATLLHELTAGRDLDAFVLFSSVAATFGLPGVANYAPGNAYLDALADHRRARGLAATSVAWGLWGAGGMVEGAAGERLRGHGLVDMSPDLASAALHDSLDHNLTSSVVLAADWPRIAAILAFGRPRRLLDEISATGAAEQARPVATGGPSAAVQLRATLAERSPAERERTVLSLVIAHAAAVLGHRTDTAIGPDRPFRDLGFDSLTAVELRNRLNEATDVRLPTTAVFDHPTPTGLARQLGVALAPDLPNPDSSAAAAPTTVAKARIPAADGTADTLDTVRADLERITAALPGTGGEGPAGRADIVRRLRRVLTELTTATAPDRGQSAVVPEPRTDDELFDLLDTELETP
ncbi:type I polyketide synthase [Frankia sp. AgB32]|uniref:type I polyketide synthase n=1 Tax=Frankia sp. AgB32 TaxID=631119 RepID=UPI00200D144C|nr:type I polyketide synthase [Frankia sp. AgB32]MCK9896150.1 SDR family NAD(P)-dependent oxidoreductase [Frankia sp. AgB32]